MKALKDVIAALRRDIHLALEEGPEGERRIEADRIVLTLQVEILEQSAHAGAPHFSFNVLDTPTRRATANGTEPRGHSLTIEFQYLSGKSASSAPVSSSPRESSLTRWIPPKLEGTEADRVGRSLRDVFGPPGFDSSARAAVFAEALEGLSADQIKSILAGLDGPVSGDGDKATKRVRHHLSNVIRSGPLKSIKVATAVLVEIFQKHPAPAVLQLVKDQWKSQEEWRDIPPGKSV